MKKKQLIVLGVGKGLLLFFSTILLSQILDLRNGEYSSSFMDFTHGYLLNTLDFVMNYMLGFIFIPIDFLLNQILILFPSFSKLFLGVLMVMFFFLILFFCSYLFNRFILFLQSKKEKLYKYLKFILKSFYWFMVYILLPFNAFSLFFDIEMIDNWFNYFYIDFIFFFIWGFVLLKFYKINN